MRWAFGGPDKFLTKATRRKALSVQDHGGFVLLLPMVAMRRKTSFTTARRWRSKLQSLHGEMFWLYQYMLRPVIVPNRENRHLHHER